MSDHGRTEGGDERELVAEAEAVRQARRQHELALSPSERLERLHALCAQVVALSPQSRRGAS